MTIVILVTTPQINQAGCVSDARLPRLCCDNEVHIKMRPAMPPTDGIIQGEIDLQE
jgi:hypothetical protein